MKRYTIAMLAIFIFISTAMYSQTLSSTITFEERVYNFGTILEEKGKVSHTFVFKNNGKTDVTIADVHSGCGCIGKVISKGSVKPGAKGKVTITFDPEYKSGFFSKEILVFSNNGNEFNRIWVEGNITPAIHPVKDEYPYDFGSGLHLRLKVIAFGYVKHGEPKQMELHYANDTNKEMTLSFIIEGNNGSLTFTNPGKINPNASGVMSFTYTRPFLNNSDVTYKVYPYVNNKKLKEFIEVKILKNN